MTPRMSICLVWELDGQIVGFSSTDQITFGEKAFMHLHILKAGRRRSGMGTQFVQLSAAMYFRVLELQLLFCQPNAFNVAPNRALQRAGFRYVLTEQRAPSPINFPQPVTRWVLDEPTNGCPPNSRSPIPDRADARIPNGLHARYDLAHEHSDRHPSR
jgi:hypothetical protein